MGCGTSKSVLVQGQGNEARDGSVGDKKEHKGSLLDKDYLLPGMDMEQAAATVQGFFRRERRKSVERGTGGSMNDMLRGVGAGLAATKLQNFKQTQLKMYFGSEPIDAQWEVRMQTTWPQLAVYRA